MAWVPIWIDPKAPWLVAGKRLSPHARLDSVDPQGYLCLELSQLTGCPCTVKWACVTSSHRVHMESAVPQQGCYTKLQSTLSLLTTGCLKSHSCLYCGFQQTIWRLFYHYYGRPCGKRSLLCWNHHFFTFCSFFQFPVLKNQMPFMETCPKFSGSLIRAI